MVMIVDYLALQNMLIDFLKNANDVGAAHDLSAGLDKRVQFIDACAEPENITLKKGEYPFILINFVNKEEIPLEIATINFNRQITIEWELLCGYDAFADAETNLYKLVNNIEWNLRYNRLLLNYKSMGAHVYSSLPYQTQFKKTYKGGNTSFNKVAVINYKMVIHVKNY